MGVKGYFAESKLRPSKEPEHAWYVESDPTIRAQVGSTQGREQLPTGGIQSLGGEFVVVEGTADSFDDG